MAALAGLALVAAGLPAATADAQTTTAGSPTTGSTIASATTDFQTTSASATTTATRATATTQATTTTGKATTTLTTAGTTTTTGITTTTGNATTTDPAVPSVELAGPTAAVELNAVARYSLRVANAPEDAEIDLVVYTPVNLDGVRSAERGELPSRQIGFLPRLPVESVRQADGTVLLTFTVVAQAPQFDDEIKVPDPGIYPVRIRLVTQAGATELARTIVFLERPPPGATLPVALVLGAPGRPSTGPEGTVNPAAADVARLGEIARLLADRPELPITIAPRPELLDALRRTRSGLLDQLALAAGHGRVQVLARTYVHIDVPAMIAANLSGEVANQLALGERAITDTLGGVLSERSVWLSDGPLDPGALAALGRLGVQTVLLRSDEGVASGNGPTDRPVELTTADASLPIHALVPEPELSTHLERPTGLSLVVAAHRLVTELATRAFGPAIGRGALLVPAESNPIDEPFLGAIADALAGSRIAKPLTLNDYLRETVVDHTRSVKVTATKGTDLTTYAQGLFVTRIAIDHLASTLPRATSLFDGLAGMMTMAGSSDLSTSERQAYFDAANARLLPVRRAITAVGREQITLAGRTGTLPIVVSNAFSEPVSVRVHVDSSKLTVTGNDRVVTVPARGSRDVGIVVEARTSAWRFPVKVDLTTPIGGDAMDSPVLFDLRVVGLSGLGIGVSAAAGFVLFTWWVTHARSRRRQRRRSRDTGEGGFEPSGLGDPPDGGAPTEPLVV